MLDILADVAPPRPVRLDEFRPPDFLIDTVDLVFELGDSDTRVKSRLQIRRNPESFDRPPALQLDGEELALISLALDGEPLGSNRYELPAEGGLIVADVPDAFTLEVETRISPETNTALSGLYMSGDNFCTQCEPEGFRRITYFVDRPDVMARYTTTIIAEKSRFPVLLSNGNPIEHGEMNDGRHWAKWVDPHPKPSYLFALVAGDLVAVPDRFTTRSGKEVALAIWVRRGDEDKCGHAMASLKKAMRWDEDVFGLEYDLDVFNIVAVSDFNMGAMENKGLNIFNTRYVLAKPDTATDTDYQNIEAVIAHEYFHNWTGNRVTCRDWFQLSLKEGLTVFRDQEFSADQGSRAVRRIAEVRILRAIQFPEDDGPLAHPVRPDSYIRIDNFYTPTVYNKGAELVRMIHTLIGKRGVSPRHGSLHQAARQPRGDDRRLCRGDAGCWRRRSQSIQALVRTGRHSGNHHRGPLGRICAQLRAERAAEGAADAGATGKIADADPVGHGTDRTRRQRTADPAGRRNGGPDRDACPSLSRGAAEFSLCRCAGPAGAIAASRFLGARSN